MISRQEMCDLLQKRSPQFKNSNISFEVQLFWEGHENVRNCPYGFEIYLVNVKTIRTIVQIFVAFSEKVNFKPTLHSVLPEGLKISWAHNKRRSFEEGFPSDFAKGQIISE